MSTSNKTQSSISVDMENKTYFINVTKEQALLFPEYCGEDDIVSLDQAS